MNSKTLIDSALKGLDTVGFQLESLGITGKVNRHTLIALVMAEQKRLEGEMDSLNTRVTRYRLKAERAADLALKPVRLTADTVRSLIPTKAA